MQESSSFSFTMDDQFAVFGLCGPRIFQVLEVHALQDDLFAHAAYVGNRIVIIDLSAIDYLSRGARYALTVFRRDALQMANVVCLCNVHEKIVKEFHSEQLVTFDSRSFYRVFDSIEEVRAEFAPASEEVEPAAA